MEHLDKRLLNYRQRLVEDIGVENKYLNTICSTIYQEMSLLSKEQLNEIESVTPVSLELRIEELKAFNMMMDRVNNQLMNYPEIIRAQVIVQNYISFVYLKDNCFEVTKRTIPSGTLTKRVCKFLLNNPVRAFRNAIAHGNWQYKEDFTGIKYYAHKGQSIQDIEFQEMTEFNVSNEELGFWQAISRAAAYTIYSYIIKNRI